MVYDPDQNAEERRGVRKGYRDVQRDLEGIYRIAAYFKIRV